MNRPGNPSSPAASPPKGRRFVGHSNSAEREERKNASKTEAEYDKALITRMRAGDEQAFAEIIARYRARMFSVAFALLKDRHEAEEIVQDTFIRAHRGIHRFRGECSLVTWLHRITVNLARNRYWFFYRRARHATLSLDCPIHDEGTATFGDVIPADQAGPAREATTTEFVELVTACMERLDPAHRQILTLRNILNHSYADIANALGIEEGTVKSRIARARGYLRALMAETCPEFEEDAAPTQWLELDFARARGSCTRSR